MEDNVLVFQNGKTASRLMRDLRAGDSHQYRPYRCDWVKCQRPETLCRSGYTKAIWASVTWHCQLRHARRAGRWQPCTNQLCRQAGALLDQQHRHHHLQDRLSPSVRAAAGSSSAAPLAHIPNGLDRRDLSGPTRKRGCSTTEKQQVDTRRSGAPTRRQDLPVAAIASRWRLCVGMTPLSGPSGLQHPSGKCGMQRFGHAGMTATCRSTPPTSAVLAGSTEHGDRNNPLNRCQQVRQAVATGSAAASPAGFGTGLMTSDPCGMSGQIQFSRCRHQWPCLRDGKDRRPAKLATKNQCLTRRSGADWRRCRGAKTAGVEFVLLCLRPRRRQG